MRLRFAGAWLVTSTLVLAPACQPEQGAPPAPTLPLPPPPPPTTPETRYLVPGFTGLHFIPGQPLVLGEGSSVFVDINWVGGGGFPQEAVPYRIVSAAPPSELSVTPSTVEVGPGVNNAGAIILSAVADDRSGEVPATYAVEIQPEGPLAGGWAYDLSRAEMQVTVVEAEPSSLLGEPSVTPCDQTSLEAVAHSGTRDVGSWMRAVHGDDLTRYSFGDIQLRAAHPKTFLSLLGPYRRPFAHRETEGGPPLYRPYPFGFLINLDLRETGEGFEQVMTLAWFDDLHLRLENPGCDALETICENGACRVR
ncbi:MAG: hypothetical protein OXH05_12750 [Acidobacteria bacterium]|nr:hypothetical protein [Acidobacteriota bacterium]